MIHHTTTGIELDIKVVPRAGRSGLAGERDGRLLVRLAAAPVDGAANDALIELLSDIFRIPKRAIRLISGDKSRMKRVALHGVSAAAAKALIQDR